MPLDPPPEGGPGFVISQRKISATQGNFAGALKDEDLFGMSVASLGDLDGDGTHDLVAGSYWDDDGGFDQGAIWVLLLRPDGSVKARTKVSEVQGGFTGILQPGDHFGTSVTVLGDLDADGVPDLAVGSDGDDEGGTPSFSPGVGAVWIVFLRANGSVKRVSKISKRQGNFRGGLQNHDTFGSAVAGIGDVDGDGIVDLAVGASGDDDAPPGGSLSSGAVWILFLRRDGTVRAFQKISALQGGFTGGLGTGEAFGSSLASLGDLDGNGVQDLAVGAPDDDDGGYWNGAVWILRLHSDGTVAGQAKISATRGGFFGHLTHSHFGGSVAALGDIDGNGVGDLAVGEQWSGYSNGPRGAVWILLLRASGSVAGYRRIALGAAGFQRSRGLPRRFGASVAGVGDANGDGVGDLVVGSPGDFDGGKGRGGLWLFALDGVGTLDFEHGDDRARTALGNGQDVSSPAEFGRTLSLASSGAHLGPAIFDSTPGGPNDPGPDPDLLVDLGSLLILQDSLAPTQTVPGFFDQPSDDPDGGTITFTFRRPVQPLSIDLVDLDGASQGALVTLVDGAGRQRVYTVPRGWTEDVSIQGPPGFRRLRLTTLDPQPGFRAAFTGAAETPGFDARSVTRLEVVLGGGGALHDLRWDPHP